jgi:glycosyltransferase involved in cell wall biosynthesis
MSVWGVSMVKGEADIVRWTVGNMVEQVEHVLVVDNCSTDGTRQLVESVGAEVVEGGWIVCLVTKRPSAR